MADELRDEAERLVDLDDRGRLIEAVTVCLRVGEQSNKTMDSLHQLDLAMVDWIRDGNGSGTQPPVHDGSSGDSGSIS